MCQWTQYQCSCYSSNLLSFDTAVWNIPIMCCSSLMYYDSLHTPLWPLVITWITLPTYWVNTSLQLNALERYANALWGIILAYNSNKVIVSFWTFSAEWNINRSTLLLLDWLSVHSVGFGVGWWILPNFILKNTDLTSWYLVTFFILQYSQAIFWMNFLSLHCFTLSKIVSSFSLPLRTLILRPYESPAQLSWYWLQKQNRLVIFATISNSSKYACSSSFRVLFHLTH